MHGARIVFPALMFDCLGCAVSMPPFLLPVNLRGGDLRSTLTASVTGSVVTFELRVTNPQTVPVAVQFSSGQQYDFRVARQNASTAWVWSADKLFTAALTSRTLAAGETVVYTATWTPAEHGSFIAEGWLTSTSHMAHAGTAFSVP